MNRRIIFTLMLLVYMLSVSPVALADLPKIPSRYTFSMGYDRLQSALKKGQPINWHATITPDASSSASGAADTLTSLLGILELSGVIQCLPDGNGWLEAAVTAGGAEIFSISQMAKDERVGLNINGEWVSAAQGSLGQAVSMLTLDTFSESLLAFDYDGFRSGDIPFFTKIYDSGIHLWGLASPWSEDNNYLRVSSGATGHGVTYTIDTAAARSILDTWANDLTRDGLYLGIDGTDFFLGVSEEDFARFTERIQALASTVELAKPITLNMAFGEGDILGYAKGSGTLQEGNKRTAISYSYSCSLSSTRITRKYNIDYQPRQSDTLVLSCTWLTSSNNKSSGAHEVSFSASGTYEGKPYRIKINSEMVNNYTLAGDGLLTELITGTLTASYSYGDDIAYEIKLKRNGETQSALGEKAIVIRDDLDLDITDKTGPFFKGRVALSFTVDAEASESPAMEATTFIESMDFVQIEVLRDSLKETLAMALQNLVTTIPINAMTALFSTN